MWLNQVKSGEKLSLEQIPSEIRADLIRLGLCEGDSLKCIARIPGGAVVLLKDLQEIAIGDNYAKKILIKIQT